MADIVERLRKADCKTVLDAFAQKGRYNTEQAYRKLEEALR